VGQCQIGDLQKRAQGVKIPEAGTRRPGPGRGDDGVERLGLAHRQLDATRPDGDDEPSLDGPDIHAQHTARVPYGCANQPFPICWVVELDRGAGSGRRLRERVGEASCGRELRVQAWIGPHVGTILGWEIHRLSITRPS
jgi:hypothetical protein